MNRILFVLALGLPLMAQNFGGPGVLSRSGGVGQRSGQDLNMRFNVSGNMIRDTGLLPYAVSATGGFVLPQALVGAEMGIGGYGKHNFRRSVLGLDYSGNYRHYPSASNYDGSNQMLSLEYSWQKSRRLQIDFNEMAGTQSFGTSFSQFAAIPTIDSVVGPGTLLFDNRMSYLQSSMTANYAISGRTTVSMGGSGYTVRRQAKGLAGVNGYHLQGALNRRISRSKVLSVSYQHTHYDYPKAFGESNLDMMMGQFSQQIGRNWRLNVGGGLVRSQVQGIRSAALDPAIAALLGIESIQTTFYQENLMPLMQAGIERLFRRASLSAAYSRSISPGNGAYLTSRQETYGGTYAYTGFKRWSLSANVASSKMDSFGQGLTPYKQQTGSASVAYRVNGGINVTTQFMLRRQDVQFVAFPKNSTRLSIGITFSPGEIPISFR